MRPIKFRAWNGKFMVTPAFGDWVSFDGVPYTEASKKYNTPNIEIEKAKDYTLMQFTGFKDKNGKKIYESDIFRVEEDGADDMSDRIYYLVITWVSEWGMFCTLRIDEYHDYLKRGLKALDEPMFWTYNLEDTNDRRFYLCGNIHENSDLLIEREAKI